MKYMLNILLSEEKIMAVDICYFEKYDRISIDGNDYMDIDNLDCINSFYHYIIQYYNVEGLEEIDIHTNIIVFDADEEYVRRLYQLFEKSKIIRIINANSIIPVIVLSKYNEEAIGKIVQVNPLESCFKIINKNDRIFIESDKFKEIDYILNAEDILNFESIDFDFLSNIQHEKEFDEYKKHTQEIIVESEKEKKKLMKQLLSQKDENAKLINELNGLQKKIDDISIRKKRSFVHFFVKTDQFGNIYIS